ncbi:hypothetical protein [Methylobacterium aquaticum]|jgi:hypothetical protein|uniref:Uncharacterized protein n=1 Tax=Methylobacterium aquaticum TaxID=270351 RepID=A0A0J6RYR0_9HYPH|nr:hypothetical protein [Methylobacterium aquaticum]KMO27970.1 hypothetical protein VP06_29065 [Methylobacterium aquaticum]
MRPAITTIAAVAGLAGLDLFMGTADVSKGSGRPYAFVQPAHAEASCSIDERQWKLIKLDMQMSQVHDILGCDGRIMAQSQFEGAHIEALIYKGRDGNVQLVFRSRRLVRKLKLG